MKCAVVTSLFLGPIIALTVSALEFLINKETEKPTKKSGAAVLLTLAGVIVSVALIVANALPDEWKAEAAVEEPVVEEKVEADGPVFEAMYRAYNSSKLVYEAEYLGNRYTVTAKINGMSTGGLHNLFGGVTLTMEKQVGNMIVFFRAEFEEDQEEVKQIVVGETVTFEGTCYAALNFHDCELVLE